VERREAQDELHGAAQAREHGLTDGDSEMGPDTMKELGQSDPQTKLASARTWRACSCNTATPHPSLSCGSQWGCRSDPPPPPRAPSEPQKTRVGNCS
jgi:hypothetical protein